MFKLFTNLASQYVTGKRLLVIPISICLLFAASALCSIESHYGSNPSDAGDPPKSYDYLLFPDSGPSIIAVLSEIQTRYDNNEKNNFTVLLANGTYSMPIIMSFSDNSSSFSELFIDLRGLGVSVLLPGDNFIETDSGNLHFKISNVSMSGGSRGIEAYSDLAGNAISFLELQNCRIFDNTNSSQGMDGTGVYANGPTVITGCDIYNNIGYNWVSLDSTIGSHGGGIAIVNDTSYESRISSCKIYNNEANAGGGIYLSGSAPISIIANKIYDNTRKFYISGGRVYRTGYGEGVYCLECDDLTFTDNLITGQIAGSAHRAPIPISSAVVMESCGYSQAITSIVIENNSFMDNNDCHGLWLRTPEGGTLIRNNLSCGNMFGIYLSEYNNGYITLKYNNAHGNDTLNNEVKNYFITNPNSIVASHNYELDPQVDASYAPLWNSSVFSWIIDAGDPDLSDPDETPSDIGAVRMGDHQHEIYEMPTGLVSSGIKWMSFPVINKITAGYNVSQNFFEPIVDPDILDWVQWKAPDTQVTSMCFIDAFLQNGDHVVTSIQGYKLKVQEDVLDEHEIVVSGYRQAPYTVISLKGNPEENWIGYFCKESSNVLDAFSPILTKITSITTQYWSITQISPGVWLGNGGERVLNDKDMVIVKCTEDCSFSWNNNKPVPPKSRELTKEFTYTEKPDYTPVYINLDQAKNPNLPAEIGLYVNGVCKGAVVVDSPEINICAYLDANETITEENSQLVFYYPVKSAGDQRSIYHINGKSLQHNTEGSEYYALKIYDLDNAIPVSNTAILSQNYPNPFNPQTTISFEIPSDGPVNLDIFNIRGQLVKRLLNTHKSLGKHSVVWDGNDDHGSSCSSGIYYYRLKCQGSTQTHKMLMVK